MKKLFGVSPLVAALSYCVLLSLFNVVANLIRKDEPRILKSILTGVVAGLTMAAVQYWITMKKAKSDVGE